MPRPVMSQHGSRLYLLPYIVFLGSSAGTRQRSEIAFCRMAGLTPPSQDGTSGKKDSEDATAGSAMQVLRSRLERDAAASAAASSSSSTHIQQGDAHVAVADNDEPDFCQSDTSVKGSSDSEAATSASDTRQPKPGPTTPISESSSTSSSSSTSYSSSYSSCSSKRKRGSQSESTGSVSSEFDDCTSVTLFKMC